LERYGKKTRREQFLEEMEQVVPWAELEALVRPHYPKGENGRPPMGPSIMLRIHFLQQWFNLRDPAAVDATIIHAPSSTKNAKGERDPEMLGMHDGGLGSGQAHASGFAARRGAEGMGRWRISGTERSNSRSGSACPGYDFAPDEIQGLCRWVTTGKEPGEGQSAREGGAPFRIVKRIFGLEKTRYRGLRKNHQRLCVNCVLANLHLYRKRLGPTGV
jgi:hypothetical protein